MLDLNSSGTLMIGIGNSGRSDDGLGWSFVEEVEKKGVFKGPSILRYQLQVEDADLIKDYSTIIFVDSSEEILEEGFGWSEVFPANDFSFTTHQISPQVVLHLCEFIYKRRPKAFLMAIGGKTWELDQGLSQVAEGNLISALSKFEELTNPRLEEA